MPYQLVQALRIWSTSFRVEQDQIGRTFKPAADCALQRGAECVASAPELNDGLASASLEVTTNCNGEQDTDDRDGWRNGTLDWPRLETAFGSNVHERSDTRYDSHILRSPRVECETLTLGRIYTLRTMISL